LLMLVGTSYYGSHDRATLGIGDASATDRHATVLLLQIALRKES